MPDNFQKLPLQQTLNAMAIGRAQQEIQRTGRALPCVVDAVDGSIVTVKFEVMGGPWTLPPITIPKAESQWLRAPTQVGDFGMTMPADTYLGGISGLGGGVADLTVDYGNMTTLVWVPVSSSNFGAAPDPDKGWLNGPAGAVLSDTAQTATVTASLNRLELIAGVGTANEVKIIYDGSGNAISAVVSAGGKVGLGALASSLAANRAVPAQADIQTLATNIVQQTLVKLASAMGTSIGSASTTWATAQLQLATIFEAAAFVPNIPGINPTIPDCSSIVRIAP
jgi:hypothetical protein